MTRRWWRRWLMTLFVVGLGAFVGGTPAWAHAELTATSPSDGEVLEESPESIELTFTEPVDVVRSPVRVIAADGSAVSVGEVVRSSDGRSLRVQLADTLGNGSYVVAWEAVSADSHPISGAFTFAVGAPSDVSGAFAAVGDVSDSVGSTMTGVGRWLSFAGLLGGFGVAAMTVVLAGDLVGARRWRWWIGAGAAAVAAGSGLLYAGQSHVLTGSWWSWSTVWTTTSGRWWAARLTVVAVLVFIALAGRRLAGSSEAKVGAVIAAVVGCSVVAAGGHSIAGRWRAAALFVTTAHLAAAALWIGGLIVLAVVVPRNRVWATAKRFSPVGLGATGVLAVTGGFASARVSDSFGQLFRSEYAAWLVLKLLLVAAMLFVAALNRLTLRRGSLSAGRVDGDQVDPVDPVDDDTRDRRLAAAINLLTGARLELAVVVVVVAMTAALTGAVPPRSSAVASAMAVPVSVSATVQGHSATVVVESAQAGTTSMHVTVSAVDAPGETADEITVSATELSQNVGPVEFDMSPAGPNHVTTSSANFPVAGRWLIEVVARYGEFDQVVIDVEVDIS